MTAITVFTGFLGAGKTTTILSLVKKLPPNYRVCILKNEYGDAQVDSMLAAQLQSSSSSSSSSSAIAGVQEITNGCLCCVLVGQMKEAILDLMNAYHPDRIIIECSGSAFPAPIAWQIREMEREGTKVCLDAILTVIDCVNFVGYEDTSVTAKMQAQYTDLILLNKWEEVSERHLDLVIDHVRELNPDTPLIKCQGKDGVDMDVVFGIDTKLFQLQEKNESMQNENDHMQREVDILSVDIPFGEPSFDMTREGLKEFIESLSKENVYRVKGSILLVQGGREDPVIVNCAFGRVEFIDVDRKLMTHQMKFTFMGTELPLYIQKIKETFKLTDEWVHFN